MRWLVEVTALGKADREGLCVEAESWQKALQGARAERDDKGPMSGFSIELLDDGCRAVDPMLRLRYEVKRAPDDMPVGRRSIPPASRPAPAPSRAPAAATSQPAPRSDVAASVAAQVIYKREHEASDSVPLTYREYVYAVAPATTEEQAEVLLQTQLTMVRSSLERVSPGKLVNLAVFDRTFVGKPTAPPLATLCWKDWRGAPEVAFPRRAKQASVRVPAPVTASVAAPVLTPVALPVAAPALSTSTTSAAIAPSAPAIRASPVSQTIPRRPPTPRAITATPGARLRGEELIADLFDAMHDLHFVRDAVEGGEFCLALAMEKIPSQAGLVHLYDIDRREFLVTTTRGPGTAGLLLRRHPESDALLSAAMRLRRALVIADAMQSSAASIERYGVGGGAKSVVIAPVMQAGRFLGAIELFNPLDGMPFTEAEGNAVTYIAEQFAEFVAARGVVTDPERISQQNLPDTSPKGSGAS